MTPEQLVAALQGLNIAIRLVAEAVEVGKRATEWTPEQEAAWDAAWEETKKSAAWQVR